MPKLKRKAFSRWLDDLCKAVVKVRDGFTCQCCNRYVGHDPRNCQWSHVHSRTATFTRWDLINAMTLCAKCHMWWHFHPTDGAAWFAEKFPSRNEYLSSPVPDGHGGTIPRKNKTGSLPDEFFLKTETFLLEKAVELGVTFDQLPKKSQSKYKTRIKENEKLLRILQKDM